MKKPGKASQPRAFSELLARAQACTVCAANLPHPPRPVLLASPTARLLIVGQAPGRRVHETGLFSYREYSSKPRVTHLVKGRFNKN